MILSLFLCLEISSAIVIGKSGDIQHKSARIAYSRFPIEILSIA